MRFPGRVWRRYTAWLSSHPLRSRIITSAVTAGTGDLIAQFVVEKRAARDWDAFRTVKMSAVYGIYVSPVLFKFLGFLNGLKLGGRPAIVPLKRLFVDQAMFGPVFVASILLVMRLADGESLARAGQRVIDDWYDIWTKAFAVFCSTNLVNFYLVPLKFQLLLIQVAQLCWSVYLAWRVDQDRVLGAVAEHKSSNRTGIMP